MIPVPSLGETVAEQEALLQQGDLAVLRELALRDVVFGPGVISRLVALNDGSIDFNLALRDALGPEDQDVLWDRGDYMVRGALSMNDSIHVGLQMRILTADADLSTQRQVVLRTKEHEVLAFLTLPENTHCWWVLQNRGDISFDERLGARFLQLKFPNEMDALRRDASIPFDEWEPVLRGWSGSARDLVTACQLIVR